MKLDVGNKTIGIPKYKPGRKGIVEQPKPLPELGWNKKPVRGKK